MATTKHILLHSKYSRSCLRLIDSLDQIADVVELILVCIDNKDIRNQICNSKSIKITKVPCLLILNDDIVETYDGEKVFLWVNQIIQNINNSKANQVNNERNQELNNNQRERNENKQVDVKEEDEPLINTENQLVNKKLTKKKVKKVNMTRIEDLDEIEEGNDDETKENDNMTIKKPPLPIRNDAGNYIFENENVREPATSNYKNKK